MREFMTIGGMQRMGFIKSIQEISWSTTSNALACTINPVVRENTIVLQLGLLNSGTNVANINQVYWLATLTSPTNVQYDTPAAPGGGTNTARAMVIEFYPGVIRTWQQVSCVGSTDTTINPVQVGKTWLIYVGAYANSYPNVDLVIQPNFKLKSDGSAITMGVGIGGYFSTYGRFIVAEFN